MDFEEIKTHILTADIVLPNYTTDEVLKNMELGITDASDVGYVIQFEYGFEPPAWIGAFKFQGVCGQRERKCSKILFKWKSGRSCQSPRGA